MGFTGLGKLCVTCLELGNIEFKRVLLGFEGLN